MKPYAAYGTGTKGIFIELIDRLLREKNDFISSEMIMEYYAKENPNARTSPKLSENKELIKAKSDIRKCLQNRNLDFVVKPGKDARTELFKYPEYVPGDLLSPLKGEVKKLRQKALYELTQKSQGLFPSSWLAKFQLQAEEEINREAASSIIEFDANEQLWNIELLPTFYYAIKDKRVLKFLYAPYGKPKRMLTFHPHYLKEYNLRWFVFGLAIDEEGKQYSSNNCALDRIESKITEVENEKYIASTTDYSTFFDDVIGVTHLKGGSKVTIEIETKDYYTYMRILTKRLHKSQKVLHPWDERKKSGRFSIEVIPNYELLGLLMGFEGHIEVFGSYRKQFKKEIKRMYNLYNE